MYQFSKKLNVFGARSPNRLKLGNITFYSYQVSENQLFVQKEKNTLTDKELLLFAIVIWMSLWN